MRVPMLLLPAVILALVGCSADTVTSTFPTDTTSASHSFYVSANGSPTADGKTIATAWDLATALNQPDSVQPGDTIWLLGGRYQGTFVSRLTGTAEKPIVLRQRLGNLGERAVIDGDLEAIGSYTWYWGFEMMFSDPQRVSAIAGSDPTDLPRYGKAIGSKGTGSFNKFINLVVHDMANGPGDGSGSLGTEFYGNIIYNNGWVGPDRGHGHSMYIQNNSPTKRIIDNVLFNSFDAGLQIYGGDAAYLWNFEIEGNTIFDSGDPVAAQFGATWNILQYGGLGKVGRSIYRDNSIYHRDARSVGVIFGYPGAPPGDGIEFSKNIVLGQSFFYDMKGYLVTGNKFTTPSTLVGFQKVPGNPYASNTWNNNQYAAPPMGGAFQLRDSSTVIYKFPGWQSATGYDAASSFLTGQFSGSNIIIRPNQYEPGRALVTIWNWDGAATVDLKDADLAGVLHNGDQFEIHHVFDIFGTPVESGTYDGVSITVRQPTLSPPAPIGYSASPAMPDNHFNVFLLQKIKKP